MSVWNLTFTEKILYSGNKQGINLEIVLSQSNDLPVAINAKLDTGSTFCIFQRQYAELLDLNVEAGDPEIIRTATGKFLTYGHRVKFVVANLEWEAVVYFAQDADFPVNVLGRVGFLDRLLIGLNDYEQHLYLNSAF